MGDLKWKVNLNLLGLIYSQCFIRLIIVSDYNIMTLASTDLNQIFKCLPFKCMQSIFNLDVK